MLGGVRGEVLVFRYVESWNLFFFKLRVVGGNSVYKIELEISFLV